MTAARPVFARIALFALPSTTPSRTRCFLYKNINIYIYIYIYLYVYRFFFLSHSSYAHSYSSANTGFPPPTRVCNLSRCLHSDWPRATDAKKENKQKKTHRHTHTHTQKRKKKQPERQQKKTNQFGLKTENKHCSQGRKTDNRHKKKDNKKAKQNKIGINSGHGKQNQSLVWQR